MGDNASKDETPKVVEEFKKRNWNLRYFYEKRQGVSFVRNTGFCLAKSDWVAYIDDDSIAAKNWLQKLSSVIKNQKKAVIIGGQTFPIYEEEPPAWLKGLGIFTRSQGAREKYLKSETAPYAINGSNMTIKKRCLEEVGGFNINLGPKGKKISFGEDPECCMRIYKIWPFIYYDPDIIVYDFIRPEQYSLLYNIKYSFIAAKDFHRFDTAITGYSNIMKDIFRSILEIKSILSLLLLSKRNLNAEQTKQLIDYFKKWGSHIGLLKKRVLRSLRRI